MPLDQIGSQDYSGNGRSANSDLLGHRFSPLSSIIIVGITFSAGIGQAPIFILKTADAPLHAFDAMVTQFVFHLHHHPSNLVQHGLPVGDLAGSPYAVLQLSHVISGVSQSHHDSYLSTLCHKLDCFPGGRP